MNMDRVKEFFALSREDALSQASLHYGVGSEELEVRELPASLGISGLAGRTCFLVWVGGEVDERPQRGNRAGAPRAAAEEERGGDGWRRDRGRGDRGRDRSSRDKRGNRRDGGRRPEARGDRPEGVDEARLEALASEAAERVRRSGESEILESMTSKERWVVHNFLNDGGGVRSVSEGEGASKRVKIIPD